eukprot:CAMPEP_0119561976 /NCGR_PEP_ID=MMETSP1352-20130426/19154_1 /TAXON_ID=265584 /ORGANISM="Stauroneis constricta, Strain CCMP1120" /LENGTH=100 /DNA_ID=CAMNT_0007610295 /DNA_START=11 /DNA_END=309 /DNA_ORIENTATION=-
MNSSNDDDRPPMDGLDQLNLGRRASLSAAEVLELVAMNDHDGMDHELEDRSAASCRDNSGLVRDDGTHEQEGANERAAGDEVPLPAGEARESRRNGLVAV